MTRQIAVTTLIAGVLATSLVASPARAEDGLQAVVGWSEVTTRGEVIVIRDRLPPTVKPTPKNYSSEKAPPYSDRAILSDAWTKAWLLLDINEAGKVTRFKFLKRPGYDLEKIAAAEAFRLVFEPGRDASNIPVQTLVVWAIEWPSVGWLEKLVGTRSRMPPLVGQPPHVRRLSEYVPCKGSGPWKMDSVHKTYRDCSKPDPSAAEKEPWITP